MSRVAHIAIFLGMFSLILLISHFYLYARISSYLQLDQGQRLGFGLLLAALAILTLLAIPLARLLPRNLSFYLSWIVFPWMGLALLLLVVVAATDVIWILFSSLTGPGHDPERRLLIQKAFGTAALSTTALIGAYSIWNGTRPVSVKPITVSLQKLPHTLDGLRVVQITDLHIGSMVGGTWLQDVVDKVNALKPDLIAITGDLVDGSVEELASHVAPLAQLAAPLGVFFITGNHEYYSGVDAWCAHVASLGIKVLRNARVSLGAGADGETFDLAGVDDWGSRGFPGGGPDLAKALQGRDTSKFLLLLAHQPIAIHEAADQGVDLQLSGHTHGGQIWPFTYLVYLQQPYVEGLFRHKDTATQIYVSPGTGFWGPPMRLGTSAEITHITLKAA